MHCNGRLIQQRYYGRRVQQTKPKKDSGIPTANDLRPQSLLDYLRKLWKGLILRRITSVCVKRQTKPSTAVCYAVLLHFQAALETAQESGADIYMLSWDIQRACDSQSKTDIKLAWIRLVILSYIADYLIAIDSKGNHLNDRQKHTQHS